MLTLKNHVVFITGASSGIGQSCAHEFAKLGCRLILAARRVDRLQALSSELKDKYAVDVFLLPLDVQDKTQATGFLEQLPLDWKAIDILVNNAGVALETLPMQSAHLDDWDAMINTNVRGLLYVTHTILPGMVERNAGHIINIGSIAGHTCYPGGNIYCATKHAVHAISQSLRFDLLGKKIRVSEISPGAVETEFSVVRWKDEKRANDFYKDFTPLTPDDVADSVVYCATRPLHVNVAEIIIYPTDQAAATFIHRHAES